MVFFVEIRAAANRAALPSGAHVRLQALHLGHGTGDRQARQGVKAQRSDNLRQRREALQRDAESWHQGLSEGEVESRASSG